MPRKKTVQWRASGDITDTGESLSRSARKRRSTALQTLGERLTELAPGVRAALPLSPDLEEALRLYDSIRDREGRRRQRQYIGRLMRDVDAEPIEAALAARTAAHQADAALHRRAEQWRSALLDATTAQLPELLRRCLPDADTATREALERTARAAREEAPAGPPHARRALFRALMAALRAADSPQGEQCPRKEA